MATRRAAPKTSSKTARTEDRPGPTVFVLFGGTGDLAKRMVLPAFFSLMKEGLLPTDWCLVGNGRGDVSHEDFRAHVHQVLTDSEKSLDPTLWKQFSERVFFAGGGFDSDDPGSLLDVLSESRKHVGHDAQLVHYLAVPPTAFPELTKALGQHDLAKGSRVVYEKPFGTSPEGFRSLDRLVHKVFDEKQVYRIDHFLGKEATQNLHVMRFANDMIEAIWNKDHISQVQIDVPERLGITDRALFYDATGATLDMLVTHLFQVAAEIAMEPPATMDASDLQSAREKVISKFRPLDPSEVVLGQFDGYRDVDGIKPRSTMDTFVAARLWIDTPRWKGVPFLLRTGKRLAESEQVVSLVMRKPIGPMANDDGPTNVLRFSLSGSGEIDLGVTVKKPGPLTEVEGAVVRIPLATLPDADPLSPYSRLLHDVLLGDRSLFTRPDGLASVWKVATPLLNNRPRISPYKPGTWGPAKAAKLAAPGRWLLGQ